MRLERMERVKGIEPSSSAWKAVALPLSYTRERQNRISRILPAFGKFQLGNVGTSKEFRTRERIIGLADLPAIQPAHSWTDDDAPSVRAWRGRQGARLDSST